MKLSIKKSFMSLTPLSIVGMKIVPSFVSSLKDQKVYLVRAPEIYETRTSYPKTEGTFTRFPFANDLYGMSTRNFPSNTELCKKWRVCPSRKWYNRVVPPQHVNSYPAQALERICTRGVHHR